MANSPANLTAKSTADSIGALGAFSIGIGGIVGGGIFATLGIAVDGARGSTFISFLVGGAVALLTTYSYVHLSLTTQARAERSLSSSMASARACSARA